MPYVGLIWCYRFHSSINFIHTKEKIMELILSSIVTMMVNLILFSIIPFIWWLIRHRKEVNFFTWIGFIKPQLKSKWWVLAIFAVLYYFFYNFDFTLLLGAETMEALAESDSVSSCLSFVALHIVSNIRVLLQVFFTFCTI